MKLLLLLTLSLQFLLAAPAFNGKRTFTQPNGETISYRLQGDEHLHWMESESGELMIYNKDNKRLESVTIEGDQLKPSGHAISHRQRSAAKENSSVSKEALFDLQEKRRKAHQAKVRKHPKHSNHTKRYKE